MPASHRPGGAHHAQRRHGGLAEELERAAQRRQRKDGRVAELPAHGALGRLESFAHEEAVAGAVSPPPGEARHAGLGRDALVADTRTVALAPGLFDCDLTRFERLLAAGTPACNICASDSSQYLATQAL